MEKLKDDQNRLLWAALVCGFIAGFDSTSTFILFPAIRSTLGNGDTASTTWILTIVGIVSAAILLQAGHLADRYGHNRIMITSAGASVLGSLLSAISPNLLFLVIGRGLQAAALAGLGVSSIAIIVRETEDGLLATAMGRWAFWTATAGISGPILSSIFVEYASWRVLFLSVVPISSLVIYLGIPYWNSDHHPSKQTKIDYLGTLAAMFGISLFVLALLEGNDWGWASPETVCCFLGGFLLMTLVIRRSETHNAPVLPLHMFTNNTFVLSAVIGFISSLMFFGMWLALLSYAIDIWGYSPMKTGLLLTVMPGSMVFIAQPAGRFADKNGFRGVMVGGAIIFTLGFLTTNLTAGESPSILSMLPALVAAGIGMATILSNTTAVGTQELEPSLVGTGTAILQTSYRVGGSLGSAVVAAILEAGQIGTVSTHKWSLWAIIICGIITALLCSLIKKESR
jgi:MFS family permease